MSLVTRNEAPAAHLGWTPEDLQQEIEQEKKLRPIVIAYFKGELKAGHHFYNLPGESGQARKPALSKEGALNLTGLFKCVPEPDEPVETHFPDGHYSVRMRVRLRSLRTGEIIATGDGSCTTREEKYAYRWVWPKELPAGADKNAIPTKSFKTKSNEWRTKYRVTNPKLADSYNTVLKMADKRAMVAAALKLPLVSELFTQDLEEQFVKDSDTTDETPEVTAEVAPPAPSTAATEDRKTGLNRLMNASAKAALTQGQLVKIAHDMHGVAGLNDLTEAQISALADEIEGRAQSTKK